MAGEEFRNEKCSDGRKTKKYIRILKTAALLILLSAVLYAAIKFEKNPEMASPENIAKLVSSNRFIAIIEFIVLYVLKGISFVFPSTALNVASGMIFEFPLSVLISCMGIFAEFSLLYMLGHFLGQEIVEEYRNKYKVLSGMDTFLAKNSFLTSFIIRIIGFVSYDVGSVYLGASGAGYGSFIAGSMLGALLNIVIDSLFGKYVFNPLNWQLWAVMGIRIAIIFVVMLIKRMIND